MDQHGDFSQYDAFGERTPAPRPMACTPTARRARAAAVAVFWSLALVIAAGRVHYGPALATSTVAAASAPIALASR